MTLACTADAMSAHALRGTSTEQVRYRAHAHWDVSPGRSDSGRGHRRGSFRVHRGGCVQVEAAICRDFACMGRRTGQPIREFPAGVPAGAYTNARRFRFPQRASSCPILDGHTLRPRGKRARGSSERVDRTDGDMYKLAFAVLVFDAGIQKLSRSSTPHEKAISLYMSNWVHRLWTFQEGMFARQLYFQLSDGVEDITAAEDREDESESAGSFPRSARTAISGHFVILQDFVDMKVDGDPMVGNWLLLPPLLHALQQRTTTRMSDETALAAGRMEVLLRQMRHFRPGIIFHHQKRMKRENYRWAPATMMGVQPGDFSRGMGFEAAVSFKGEGFSVRYPGFILEPVRAAGSQVAITMKHF
ncbi:hypothetical protein B0H12DRAFT_636643 [Mycena haematopus]|nr:hypothetical protein B0H12DRAFT_636643 [Mycena haematopus]